MKIQRPDALLERVRRVHLKPSPSPATDGFREVLKSSLNQASVAAPLAGSPGALTVQLLPKEPLESDSISITARLEEFLNLMEEYRRSLADPRTTLKDLNPLMGALERRREALAPLLESHPMDTGLRDIFNRALVTAEVEIMRFRRGDYLPA